ncbi:MAG: multicopper oxidase domain-containing protein [Nitrospiria bacterium]
MPNSFPRGWCFYKLFILSIILGFFGTAVAENLSNPPDSSPISASQADTDWQTKFKNQLINESKMEGHPGLPGKVDNAMANLMQEIMLGPGHQNHITSGPYQEMSAIQQMDRSFFLGPGPASETVNPGGHCPSGTPRREFDVTTINIEITLNQWGDYYPGYMYVLTENIQKVREEEKRNKDARKESNDLGAVSTGLQRDLIQPLTIRGNQGDCVFITLRNEMQEDEASMHIHGSSMIIKATGQGATMTNPDSVVKAGKIQTFEWYIRPDEQEGAHMFHSHIGRESSSLGLFGGFIVEPKGSVYINPITGKESSSGWQMMVVNDKRVNSKQYDFREFVIYYHEIGDKGFRTLNKHGEMVPQRDPWTSVYNTGRRGINYRTEPFGVNNFDLQEKYFHFADESMGYSSYTFGDISTSIPRSYMGDPAKFRIIHGASEDFHSHHPHGGAIRWLRQPKADVKGDSLATAAENGPIKYPEIRTTSDRVDAQVIGPSEAIDIETECGSGLCQQLAGDFLFHCHVAQHYVAGMWSYWRVYNTLQTGNYPNGSTDVMPPLLELPDRKGRMKPPVTSDQLVGKTLDWYDKKWHITKEETNWSAPIPDVSIKEWVKMMLPPAGQPGHTSDEKGQIVAYDASVWDWTWLENKALGETEVTGQFAWPKYKSPMPGQRPPILFDPVTGKTAWPHLKPHFGKRPPFARHHGPAAWLEPIHMDKDTGALSTDPGSIGIANEETTLPAKPGEQGQWSLCPSDAGRKQYTVHFIETSIELSKPLGNLKPVIDPDGLLYVLQEEEEEVKKNNEKKLPLVYRANVYDCVDIILKSEWTDNDSQNFQSSKINIHPHFVQFDNQASDGVITGFSYEQSVRPFTMIGKEAKKGLPPPMNALISENVEIGSKKIKFKMGEGATPFHVDTEVMIGMERVKTSEIRRIHSIQGNTLVFNEPLRYAHKSNEIISAEFIRYRYWVDSDLGTVYWHDHAFGVMNWSHGAIGAMIIEPRGSTYHNPKSGAEIRSGPIADVYTAEPVGYDYSGSFRELVIMLQDSVATTAQVVTEGSYLGTYTIKDAINASQLFEFRPPSDILRTSVLKLQGFTVSTGSGLNFRTESIARRLENNPDPSIVFSSLAHQDPSTPLLKAYLGDTVVIRLLHALVNESHTWHIAGHAFRPERYAQYSNLRNALHVGIAERFDLVFKAGGPQQMAGDYLHYNGRASHLSEGSWGILRVLDKLSSDLKPLPGHENIPSSKKMICPSEAPLKSFTVLAIERPLNFNVNAPDKIEIEMSRKLLLSNPRGKIFTLEGEKSDISNIVQPMPLTLHVNSGDCIKVVLKNKMKAGRTSFSADMLAFDPKDSQGINVGNNPGDQTIGPGQEKSYTFYAPPEYGEFAANVWDWGNPLNNVRDGLFGAIIIGPKGAKFRNPKTGEDSSLKNSWLVDVILDRTLGESSGRSDYRDASLFFQDKDVTGNFLMPYVTHVAGLTGVNYRSEPWSWRQDQGCELWNIFSACVKSEEEPVTPTILAHAGDPVRIHVFGSFNEQNQVFSLEGHEWPLEPRMIGSDNLSSLQFGGSENLDVFIKDGAGGPFHIPGDYLWQNHRVAYWEAGQWGYLRVLPVGDRRIMPLNIDSESLMFSEISDF